MEFRKLKADEIECRVSTVKSNGVSLLLYKDARCDMNILDETVGPMNWQRVHGRDNANCTVLIWDSEKAQWVGKEDTGTESNTEKEKGLASDSFKRACFNWGIGRELYTAPFIWVDSKACTIKASGRKDKYGNDILTCSDRFQVISIGYDDNGKINSLKIANEKTLKEVYSLGASTKPNTKKAPADYSELLKAWAAENEFDLKEIAQDYKLNSKTTQARFKEVYESLKGGK